MHQIDIDAFDIRILRALQEDGRLTSNDLAARVGLSPSQCSRRRQALEEAGVIANYHATLSAEKIGLDVLVFVYVTLSMHSPDNAKHFLALTEALDEVQEAYTLTGEYDYLLKLAVPSLTALTGLLAEVIVPHPSVLKVRSSIVLKRLKQSNRLPLSHLSPVPKSER